MSDDIVTRLRAAKGVNWSHYSAPPMGPLFDDAADEIERLRAAGDAMATSYQLLLDQNWSAFAASFLHAWREARRD